MTGLLFVPALLAAVGVGVLTYVGLSGVADLFRSILGRRRRSILALPQAMLRGTSGSPLPSEEALYGLPRNLSLLMVAAALVGLAVSWALLDGPLQGVGLAAGALPLFWKRRRLAQARQEVRREVARLIEELRLRLAFGGSLGTALSLLAQEERSGLVCARLRAHRDLVTVSGPEAVLEQLAGDLHSAELRFLLWRVRAARRGGATYSDALRASADEVIEEIGRQAAVEVEGAPLRLMLPMLILLLPPIIALTLYPPAYALIASLTGAGPGMLP